MEAPSSIFDPLGPSGENDTMDEETSSASHVPTENGLVAAESQSNHGSDNGAPFIENGGSVPGGEGDEEGNKDENENEEDEQVKHVRELVRRKRRRARAPLSGPAWEAGVKGAAEWNGNLLRDRYLRGPWYWDPHSRSPQVFRQWLLSRTPAVAQVEALASYLLPLAPDQQSAVLAAYMIGPTGAPLATASSAAPSSAQSAQPSPTSLGEGSAKKARGKRQRPKGPHCRMCLKEESEPALIRCTECKDQYHPDCLELKKENIPKMVSFGWRCMHCKKCETCRDTGNEEKLLFCDACDRGFHTFCLSPPLKRPPNGGWFCLECVECKSCGGRTAGKAKSCRWHRGYTMCEMCYKRFKHDKYCPVCSLVYQDRDARDPSRMRSCANCRHAVHASCDGDFAEAESPYVCPPCRKKGVKGKNLKAAVSGDEEEEDKEEEEKEKKKKAKARSPRKKTGGDKKEKKDGRKKKGKKSESEEEDEEEEDEEEDRKKKGKKGGGRSPVDGKRKRKSAGGEKEGRGKRELSPRSKRSKAGENGR
jgi:hypothetical protein